MRDPDATGNLLLDALTSEERSSLLRDSDRNRIEVDVVRRHQGDAVTSVFFPTSGTLSVIVDQADGRIEAATIGREGVCDAYAALGSRVASQEMLGQVTGESIDVSVETFTKVFEEGPTLRPIIHGFIEALFSHASLSASCLALHHVNERCARWLLETHDRVDSDTFDMKQEFLAMMLGVHRPSVSIAAGSLQAAGMISYRRGKITVVDREGLEASACSCYEAIRTQYSRLVPLR
jgi:CRP-like cAMP-binding protein